MCFRLSVVNSLSLLFLLFLSPASAGDLQSETTRPHSKNGKLPCGAS